MQFNGKSITEFHCKYCFKPTPYAFTICSWCQLKKDQKKLNRFSYPHYNTSRSFDEEDSDSPLRE